MEKPKQRPFLRHFRVCMFLLKTEADVSKVTNHRGCKRQDQQRQASCAKAFKAKDRKRLWHKRLKALQNRFCAEKHHFKRMSVVFPYSAFWVNKEESLD